jgi:hypothetical protein
MGAWCWGGRRLAEELRIITGRVVNAPPAEEIYRSDLTAAWTLWRVVGDKDAGVTLAISRVTLRRHGAQPTCVLQ